MGGANDTDTVSDDTGAGGGEKSGGWSDLFLKHLKDKAHQAVDDLHDRLTFVTRPNKEGIEDAMNDQPTGFQKAKDEDGKTSR